jgi:hypothetical protein
MTLFIMEILKLLLYISVDQCSIIYHRGAA